MPTYEFRCPNGHAFDKFFRSISDAQMEWACPECGETAARQISGGAGLVFKGSGFYLTDYGKNAHRGTGSGSESKGAESKGGDAKGGEAKGGESKSAEGKSGGDAKSGGDVKPAGGSDAGTKKPVSGDKA